MENLNPADDQPFGTLRDFDGTLIVNETDAEFTVREAGILVIQYPDGGIRHIDVNKGDVIHFVAPDDPREGTITFVEREE